jgi:glycosyltransferase involved in cell wall biosynthesis
MARGDVVIANSHYTARMVRERHGTPEDRLHVIPRAVDLGKFSLAAVSAERVARLREAWGVPQGARVILQASRLTRWKGQNAVIGAAGLLKDRPCFQDAVIVLAGDDQGRGAYRQELAARIADLGLTGKVLLPGHCADMPAAFAAAWLTLVPSIEPEAFGRASIEAQAMGCPVIVSDIGALPETLPSPGAPRTGWLTAAGNEAAMARAIEAALEMSGEARSEMAGAAQMHAKAFSKTALQKKTLQLYDYLLRTELANAFAAPAQMAEWAHRHG